MEVIQNKVICKFRGRVVQEELQHLMYTLNKFKDNCLASSQNVCFNLNKVITSQYTHISFFLFSGMSTMLPQRRLDLMPITTITTVVSTLDWMSTMLPQRKLDLISTITTVVSTLHWMSTMLPQRKLDLTSTITAVASTLHRVKISIITAVV